jgi:hypothetical protein
VNAPEISDPLRAELDEIPVSKLAEYLCGRLELDEGEKLLQLLFRDGRYQRMARFATLRGVAR